jgi:hypothetical protein
MMIDELKMEHAANKVKIEQYSNGGHKRKRAKKYRNFFCTCILKNQQW